MSHILIFISSVQKEFAGERKALRDFLRGDPLLRRFFEVFLFEHDAQTVELRLRCLELWQSVIVEMRPQKVNEPQHLCARRRRRNR